MVYFRFCGENQLRFGDIACFKLQYQIQNDLNLYLARRNSAAANGLGAGEGNGKKYLVVAALRREAANIHA